MRRLNNFPLQFNFSYYFQIQGSKDKGDVLRKSIELLL